MGSSRKASSSVEPAFVWTKKLYFFIVKNRKNAEKRKIFKVFIIIQHIGQGEGGEERPMRGSPPPG